MRRAWVIAVVVGAAPAAGCGVRQADLKTASLAGWADAPVEGVPAHEYLRARWGMVVPGRGPIEILENGRSVDFRGLGAGDDGPDGGGAAVHVGGGYWLTAAHCAPARDVRIVRLRPLTPVVLEARVVWRGGGDDRDLALLHTPGIDPSVPGIGLCGRPPAAGDVLCMGSGLVSAAWAAGSIAGVTRGDDPDFATLAHTAPLGPGDSGGAAMLADGRVAGINVRAASRTRDGRGRSWAVWVSPERVRRMIREDAGAGAGRPE